MDVLSVLRRNWVYLSRKRRKIADRILAAPETACFLSLRDLAEQAGTTEVTVVRFVKDLGFKSFMDFKKELQSQVREWLTPNERVQAAISAVSNTPKTYQMLLDQELQNLNGTFEALQYEEIQRAASLLRGAERIYIVGHEVTEAVALLMEHRVRQLGFLAERLNITNLHAVSRSTALSHERDLFVLISMPSYCVETAALSRFLAERGRRFIAITDSPESPIVSGAQVALTCASGDTVFYNSIISAIVMVNVVCSLLAIDVRDSFERYKDRYKETFHTLCDAVEVQKEILGQKE